jgi:tetratricopeptide (TPR) repeat protein
MIRFLSFALICISFSLKAQLYEERVSVLYNSIQPESLTELFAFYNLYPETEYGKKAYQTGWNLINLHRNIKLEPRKMQGFQFDIKPIISLVTKEPYEESILLTEKELETIDLITSHLKNRNLKGRNTFDTTQIVLLPPEEVDLARTIFLFQFGKDNPLKIRTYEAYVDMMALQILARLEKNFTELEAIEAINQFIFHEMRYRFPPHSMWTEDVDLYTFLPSVLDSRHGVCLGVSILYLSLAQRIGLELDIITPPGHIYLSHSKSGKELNIETTARGIHIPTEMYLGINNKTLKRHNIKNVVGLNFMNAAATMWHQKKHKEALTWYKKAELFLPNYPLLMSFIAYNEIMSGNIKEGKIKLAELKNNPVIESLYQDTIADDLLSGKIDSSGLDAVFEEVNETRESVLQKKAKLEKILRIYPQFREGIFHLAITHLQLGRNKEAIKCLEDYHKIDPNNPTVEYYLATLQLQRWNFKESIKHLNYCKSILSNFDHNPKIIQQLEKGLRQTAPIHLM